MPLRFDQLDTVASEFEGVGTGSRQLSLKAGGIVEGKLGFAWETQDILASAFTFDGTRSNYTLAFAASADGNVDENAELLRNGVGGMDREATTTATGRWSLSGTTLSVHGDITATGDTYTIRYVTGTSSGVAASSGNLVWVGTVGQNPIHAKSDYFLGGTLETRWTEWDVDSHTTVSVNGELQLTQTSHAGESIAGILQTAPAAAQYAVTVDLGAAGATSTSSLVGVGVVVGDDLITSPSTAAFITMELALRGTAGAVPEVDVTVSDWTDYNTSFSVLINAEDYGLNIRYLRIFVDNTANDFDFLVSTDGKNWIKLGTATQAGTTVTGDPAVIGLTLHNVATGEAAYLHSRMFRVDETTDPFLPVGGYVGTSVPATFKEGRPVAVSGGNTVNEYGWAERRAKLVKCEVFSAVPATIGAYTFALTKDPGGTPVNMLSAATFDMTTLSALTPTSVTLSSTVDDLIVDVGDVWRVALASDNAGLDAQGVYFQLTWLAL